VLVLVYVAQVQVMCWQVREHRAHAPRQRFASKPCLPPQPTSALDAAEQLPLTMITRILRSLPFAITALACLASGARAAEEAKNDYGTVIGIGTRYYSLTALNSSSSHYVPRL